MLFKNPYIYFTFIDISSKNLHRIYECLSTIRFFANYVDRWWVCQLSTGVYATLSQRVVFPWNVERSKHTSIMVEMGQKDSYIGNKTQ